MSHVEEEEEIIATSRGTPEDNRFDKIIGTLQDILMDPEFTEMVDRFCQENSEHFEDTEENKLIYTNLFQEYCSFIELYIDRRLTEVIPDFSMDKFLSTLEKREDEVCGDVFDMLLSFGDFEEFKHLMLSYKRSATSISVDGTSMPTTIGVC